jgi:hypothetical protein
MPDEKQTEGTGSAQDASATKTTSTAAPATEDGEEFDAPRAMATIKHLREVEKAGKAAIKRLADIEGKATQDEADRLKAAGEHQKLAERAEARVKELEPVKERADRLLVIVQARLERERKGLPKHVLTLLDKLPAEDQLAWLDENAEALAKDAKTPPPNLNPKDGQGKAVADPQVYEAQLRQRMNIR